MIGDKIKELRKAKRYTQKELGTMCNVSDISVYKWETGRAEPAIETICRLADIFGVTTDFLLDREPLTIEKKQSLPEQPAEGRERIEFIANKDMVGDTKTLEEYIRAIVRNEMNK